MVRKFSFFTIFTCSKTAFHGGVLAYMTFPNALFYCKNWMESITFEHAMLYSMFPCNEKMLHVTLLHSLSIWGKHILLLIALRVPFITLRVISNQFHGPPGLFTEKATMQSQIVLSLKDLLFVIGVDSFE